MKLGGLIITLYTFLQILIVLLITKAFQEKHVLQEKQRLLNN
jgi:hypothetical protein